MANAQNGKRRDGWYYSQSWWRIAKIAYLRYHSSGAFFMAAAIAFYALICLAPLGILLASLLQQILRGALIDPSTYAHLQAFVRDLAGGAAGEIMRLISSEVAHSGGAPTGGTWTARLIGAAALIWAGLRLFDIVQLSLLAIWPGRRIRAFFLRKLVSLGMMVVAGVLFALLVLLLSTREVIGAWLRQFPQLDIELPLPQGSTTFILGLLISGVAYLLLYKYLPAQKVETRAALVGAVFSALVWQSISPIFTRFISLSHRADPVFGNLSWMVIFGLWAFLGAQVLLLGAQLAAAYEHVFCLRRPRGEDDALIDISRRRTQLYTGDLDAEAERIIEELELDREPAACELDPTGNRIVNGVILGGGKIAANFAERVGTDTKGLIQIDGRACIEYVVEAMRQVPGMRKLVLVADKAAYLHHPVAEKLDGIIDEGPDITHNLMRAIRFLNEDRRILLSTSDIPLLTSEALCAFLGKCDPEADLCYPVTTLLPTRRLFGRRVWVFLPLREGWVTHTCNILFDPRLVLRNVEFVERFLTRRKDLWGAAGTVGVGFMLRFFLSWYLPFLRYDAESMGEHIALMTGARRCQGILLDYPEIALDIDKPTDVEEIEDFIQREKERGRWRPSLADASPVESEPPQ
jgi:YihY family inner membrane protein